MEDAEQHRILLVDYDDDLLTRLKILLADDGYDVTTAWGRKEALGLLSSKRFDVILLSDHLPDTNGRELWRRSEDFLPMLNWLSYKAAITRRKILRHS